VDAENRSPEFFRISPGLQPTTPCFGWFNDRLRVEPTIGAASTEIHARIKQSHVGNRGGETRAPNLLIASYMAYSHRG
jgi:hypothetical protein